MKDNLNWPIVGHNNAIDFLKKSIIGGNLAHAYLFCGPTSVGKKTIARYFLSSILCSGRGESIPCAKCSHCLQIQKNIHPDVFWIKREKDIKKDKEKKNISIEQIRDLQSKLNMGSFLNNYKISVIEEAQTLSKKAANALLKGLEEPKEKTILILITSDIRSVIPTVLSRCQIIRFFPVSSEEIHSCLLNKGAPLNKVRDFARISGGRIGSAIDFYENSQKFDDYNEKADLFFKMNKSDISQRFKVVSDIIGKKDNCNMDKTISVWISLLRDALLIKSRLNNLINNTLFFDELSVLARKFSLDNLKNLIEHLERAKLDIRANINQKLVLDNFVLNFNE